MVPDVTAPVAQRELAPLDPPTVPFAVGGIVLWAILALALLPFRDTLADHGRASWFWICVAGFIIGFPGLFIMIKHDRNRRIRRAHPDR